MKFVEPIVTTHNGDNYFFLLKFKIIIKMTEINDKNLRKGIVYVITCNITDERYFGSTTRTLEDRIKQHKLPGNLCTSKQIIDRGDYSYEILETVYFEYLEELLTIEAKYIRENNCINHMLPISTDEERINKIREYEKQYYEKNRKKKIEYQELYRRQKREMLFKNCEVKIRIYKNPSIDCPCGGKYIKQGQRRHFATDKHKNYENN